MGLWSDPAGLPTTDLRRDALPSAASFSSTELLLSVEAWAGPWWVNRFAVLSVMQHPLPTASCMQQRIFWLEMSK